MSAALPNSRPRNKNRPHNTSSRGSYQNANSSRRETPEPEVPYGVYADARSAVMMCSIMGTQSTVKTVNGKTYKGRVTAFSDKVDIALADAKLENEDGTPGPNLAGIVIPKDKFVVCKTNGVDLKGFCSSADFTDSGIVSRMNGSAEGPLRELQPWQDDDATEVLPNLSLDDHSGGWDAESMFEENHQKFSLKTSYDTNMHEYTTRLPQPGSEAYAAKERFAKEKAEEIERDETYQRRIAKELSDNDDDSRFSFVHRDDSTSPQRTHESGGGKNMSNLYPSRQGYPPLRADRDRDRDEHLRNGNMHRGHGRGGPQRQNSPYSSGGHMQHSHHTNVHNARQPVNNHYQQGPPPSGPLNRNQGHMSSHLRQQPHQPSPSSQSHGAQPPPHHHYSSQQHVSQQGPSQHRIPQHQQQVVSPTQPPPGKPPHHLPSQSVPSSSPSSPPSSSSPVQSHQPPTVQKPINHHHHPQQQQPLHNLKAAPSSTQGVNGVLDNQLRHQGSMQLNGGQPKVETKNPSSVASEVAPATTSSSVSPASQYQNHTVSSPTTSTTAVVATSGPTVQSQQKSPPADASSISAPSSGQPAPARAVPSPSSTSTPSTARSGRNSETNPEEARSKIADLQDFKEKFVLEHTKQEESGVEPVSSQVSTSTTATQPTPAQPSTSPDSTAPHVAQPPLELPSSEAAPSEKKKEEPAPTEKPFKLNPNAPEFKPKAPVEAQSPSPQPRSSPQVQVVQYPPPSPIVMQFPSAGYHIMHQNSQRKRATVSLQANVDLTHQVTGQPLLATQSPHMPPMMYIQGAPATGYQIMGRMPNSLAMAQGQHAGMDQAGAQNQHVFALQWPLDYNPSAHVEGAVPAQQQPMPAHMPHPQPAHAGPMQQQPPVQQAQPAHVPNPAPSPVQQHPQHPQHSGQPGIQQQPQHHQMGQGPPQSATPQPPHYMNFSQHGMPRTSLAGGAGGQQSMTGHPAAASISYMSAAPQYASYQNATSGAQYSFAPAAAAPAQPQTSQNSTHGQGGSHPQYVVMPQAAPQGHPPMPQHSGQAYAASGLPFHPQHNLMQGPPQMPPNHGHNPNQGGPHLLHGMPAGLHQQVAGSQPSMFMPMPSPQQLFQHQQ